MRQRWIWLVGIALGVAACAPSANPSPSAGSGRVAVVTTTTVFADFVAQVGGDRVDVHALVPRGADVHTFDPAPGDARAISAAKVLFMNGLGLDDWLEPVMRDSGATNTRLVKLAEDLPGATYLLGEWADGEGGPNPHLWLYVAYARAYAARIAAELSTVDPYGKQAYEANLAAYDARLGELDTWIRDQFAGLPPQQRRVVSFHDAFPYFAAAYGLEIIGVVVPAPGQEPSATEVARLIEAIRDAGARAILAEAQFDDRLVQAIAAETGARVVEDLYDDSLGDPPIDSYEGVMRWDVNQIVGALR